MGHCDRIVGFFLPRSLGFCWRIVRRESERHLMRTKLAMELASFDVIAFF